MGGEMKIKTVNDLKAGHRLYVNMVDMDILKTGAIKVMKDALKKRKNMFKVFLKFHNITEEDLK